jgi:hypothetical protein
MKRKLALLFCILFLTFCFFSLKIYAQAWPPSDMLGNGSESDPWEIITAEHLADLAAYVNAGNGLETSDKYYKLMNNIDLGSYSNWSPIGNKLLNSYSFNGNFQGNNKVIQNLSIYRSNENYIGLFGYIRSNGYVQNLGIENCDVIGRSCVGGLVGYNDGATISNCYIAGNIKGKSSFFDDYTCVGGLVGFGSNFTITDSYVAGNVTTETSDHFDGYNVGGLVGYGTYVTITNCYSTCNVSGNEKVGGIAGIIYYATISNSYAIGDIIGREQIGGLVGINAWFSSITDSYTTGNVTGSNRAIGGLVGYTLDSYSITNCYTTGNVYGAADVGGLVGDNSHLSHIINCYTTGNITGSSGSGYRIGGLVGDNYYASIVNCYATGHIIGGGEVGGLVGSTREAIIRNCVAANNLVTGKYNVNRIYGNDVFNIGTFQNNYSLNTMIVKDFDGNVPIIDSSNNAGIGIPLAILKKSSFYAVPENWNDGLPWNITGSDRIWDICNGVTLPWLRWQEIECPPFIPVINITDAPTTVMSGIPIILTGKVIPDNATNNVIIWSIQDAGTTGATIDGSKLNTTGQGIVVIRATIMDGIAVDEDYTQDFSIEVKNVGIEENGLANITVFPNPSISELRIESGELRVVKVDIFDVFGRNIGVKPVYPENSGSETVIHISHLSAGVYFLKINTETGQVIKKVVKK